ncbi:hypothetical protein LTR95_010631, partial [Oleoguttula sp. CCFEE 5521]
SYPPHRSLPAHTITPSAARSLLSNFLSQTPTSPHLHPDALLTASGITFSPNSGPTGGLALHHLDRIAVGLRGENLAQESKQDWEALFGAELGLGDDTRVDGVIKAGKSALGKRGRSVERVEEWQDLGDFQREQRDLEGEVGDREGGGSGRSVRQDGQVPGIEVHGANGEVLGVNGVVEEGQEGGTGAVDRAARKAAKKARKTEEKKKAKAG